MNVVCLETLKVERSTWKMVWPWTVSLLKEIIVQRCESILGDCSTSNVMLVEDERCECPAEPGTARCRR